MSYNNECWQKMESLYFAVVTDYLSERFNPPSDLGPIFSISASTLRRQSQKDALNNAQLTCSPPQFISLGPHFHHRPTM